MNRKVLKAAELNGLKWINHTPLTLKDLKGKVVLINFWDYSYYSCLRTITYLKVWYGRYRDKGLEIIGIHAPEFSFGRNEANVKRAVEDLGIQYPVAMDNDFQVWRAYSNKYWPSEYLIDADGYLADYHLGPGMYKNLELSIQELIREIDPHVILPHPIEPLRPEDRDGIQMKYVTPDMYLGFKRGRIGNPEGFRPNEVVDYARPAVIKKDMYHAIGKWKNLPDALEAQGDGTSELIVSYEAKGVGIVVEPGSEGEQFFEITQDGAPVEVNLKNDDDVRIMDGKTLVYTDYPRLYLVVDNPYSSSHILTIKTEAKGMRFYSFNFISQPIDSSVL